MAQLTRLHQRQRLWTVTALELSSVSVPALKAPLDYVPKTIEVKITVPRSINLIGCSIVIDPEEKLNEITRRNNRVVIK